MNFFAHYHFYHKPNNNWHNTGLLFPDLLRIFTKSRRISENSTIALYPENLNYINLVDGIQNHFKADDIFHNWDWFKEKNHELALVMRESKLEIKRDWFLAHIFIELAIDHVLVSENESKVNDLYSDLANCGKKEWEFFFTKNNIDDFEIWFEGFSRFIKHRYIFTYKDTDNVIYALNRIYQSTGIGEFDTTQKEFLLVLLNTFVPEVKLKISELQKLLE